MAKQFKNNYLFEYLRNILTEKSWTIFEKHVNDVDFDASFSPYMVITYLSMSTKPAVRDIVLNNQLTLERFPKKQLYRFLIKEVPKQYNSFITFIR